MRKTLPYVALLCLIFAGIFLIPSRKKTSLKEPERSAKFDNIRQIMEQEFRRTRDPKLNRVPRERLLVAQEVKAARLAAMEAAMAVPGINWTERGPNNIGGRTRAVWFDLNDAPNYRKVWAAGVSGGLWYTNDITVATPVWNKVDDFFDNLAITCFVQDPDSPNVMYFGTGEGWFNIDAVQGMGIWKSEDGGATWDRLPSTSDFLYVQDLLIDANGHLYASVRPTQTGAGAFGVQKSTNGGNSWTQVLGSPVFGSSPRGADLELASNGDIYASLGTTGSNGGIYRSIFATHGASTGNAGTWVNITPNSAGVIQEPNNFWNRIELAGAPSNANIVYALFQGYGSANCTSIQQYNAATNTWTVRSVPTIVDQGAFSNFTRGQAFYDLIAAVDPNDANRLYIGGVDALRSDNGGASWMQMSTWSLFSAPAFTPGQYVHADHHAIVYVPGSSSRVLWGTDGGLYYTTNADITGGAKPTWTAKNTGYNVTQYYSCAIHPTLTNYFLAGAQDNGTHQFTAAGMNSVTEVTGGDGGFTHIDQDEPNIQITSYVNNNYFVSTNGGASFVTRSKNGRGDFINPSDYDNTANILYAGDNQDSFYRWTSPATNGPDAQVLVTSFNGSFVSHVTVSPLTPNRVYFGLYNGSVVMVDNAHTGTAKTGVIIKPAVIGHVVSCIAIDPADENHMLVTYSNYGVNQVWESNNALSGSPTWTVVDGDLPDMPVRWAMFDPRNSDWAILATELGVWSTDNLDGAATAWSPTNSGLANVRVDMLQYRPSDGTIAAATHGRGLFTAVIPQVTTPDINFQSGSTVATEQTISSDGCLGYRDYSVTMTIANPPTGDATITVNIEPGNTATPGQDFDYTTNGSFTTPSNSFVFASGSTTPHTITVRVYDDPEVEPAESFTLSYTISGTTNAQPGIGAQLHTFTINSDDGVPAADTVAAIVGTYNANLPAPFFATYTDGRFQQLYLASELTAAGFSKGTVTEIGLYVVQKNTSAPYNGFTIKMKNTATTTLTGAGPFESGTTVVFGPVNYSTVMNLNVFPLTTPFEWDGVSNLLVEICYDNTTASGADDLVAGTGPMPMSQFMLANSGTGCTLPNANYVFSDGGARPVMAFSIASLTPVASALSTSSTAYLGPNSDVYFYSSTGEIMARIRNLSAHDYGCTQVVIDRAGTGATAFWNNTPAQYLMDKTFRVIPTNNNPSGQYEITLYYTEDEVNGWEAATGQSFNAIQMVKVPSQISNVTPATPEPDGPASVQVVDPVRGSFGSNATLTFTFLNGFSGFGAGIPGSALPVTLLGFEGKMVNNTAQLAWKTATEQNSMGFEIEKSNDGVTFHKIGYVAAAGNSTDTRSYQFTDENITHADNYYRLKLLDINGSATYSKVLLLKYFTQPLTKVKLLRNPVQDYLDMEFDGLPNGAVGIKLVDPNGRILGTWNNPQVLQTRMRVNIGGLHLAKGAYIMQVQVNGKNFTERILKE